MGRPSDYTPEMDAKICDLISGGMSLSAVCRQNDFPSRDTVYSWMGANQAFADRYARAVEDRAETLAEGILNLADLAAIEPTTEGVAAVRVQIDSRKWIASKLFPKKYGDSIRHEGEVTLSISDKLKEARERAASGS